MQVIKVINAVKTFYFIFKDMQGNRLIPGTAGYDKMAKELVQSEEVNFVDKFSAEI